MKLAEPNQDSQKMASLLARLPRPAADGLYLALPTPYPNIATRIYINTTAMRNYYFLSVAVEQHLVSVLYL